MPPPLEIPPPVARQILDAYLSGLSLMEVQLRYRAIPRHKIRRLLKEHEVMRDAKCKRSDDPSPAELIQERDRIKNSWSAEEASRRWVGRTQSRAAEERSRALSKLIPD